MGGSDRARLVDAEPDRLDQALAAQLLERAEGAVHRLAEIVALLLRAVCAGNIAFFEAALAALSRIPEQRIAHLVRAGRAGALRAIYTKAGLPGLAFDAFAAALDTWRRLARDGEPEDRYRSTMQMVDAVLARYSSITDGEANELAAMLRRFAADQARDAARDLARAAA